MLSTAPDQNFVELPTDALYEVAENIWSSVLELVIQRAEEPLAAFPTSELLTGQVAIHGSWQGSLILVCSKTVARRAAAVMFKTAPSDITETESRDTVGELTHMLGGNLKSLLPSPSRLSLPTVTEGYNKMMVGRPVGHILLRCENQPLQISLFEREYVA